MIPLARMRGRGGRRKLPELEFLGSAQDTANRTTYEFLAQPFGDAAADREIICIVHSETTIDGRVFSSATIGGIGADLVVEIEGSGWAHQHVAIFSVNVQAGASGTISVTFTGEKADCGLEIYRMVDHTDRIAADTAVDDDAATTIWSGVLNIPQGAVALAGVMARNTNTYTFAGLVEDNDAAIEAAARHGSASAQELTADPALTVSATKDAGGSTQGVLAAATWR